MVGILRVCGYTMEPFVLVADDEFIVDKISKRVFVSPLRYLQTKWESTRDIDTYIEWRWMYHSIRINKMFGL